VGAELALISVTSDLIRATVTLIALPTTPTPLSLQLIDTAGKLIAALRTSA
jgi:hypothetical protein